MSEKQTDKQPPPQDKKPPGPVETVNQWLVATKKEISRAAAAHVNVDRLTRLALTAMRRTPDLQLCTPVSLIASVMQCAQLGLEPDAMLGHIYLVPFKNHGRHECQPVIGYKGMIELALRSGKVQTVEAYPVYEGDHFEYELGINRRLEHIPAHEDDTPEKLTHAYAIVRLLNGGILFSVMTRRAIDMVRKSSPGSGNPRSPWNSHFVEMAMKSPIRRVFKFTPVSSEMARGIGMEERAEAGLPMDEVVDINGDPVALTALLGEAKVPDDVGEVNGKKKGGKLDNLVDDDKKKKTGEKPEHRADCALNRGGKECDLGCLEPEPPTPEGT